MLGKSPNHPFVVWAACILWVISIFAILWSLFLFFCVGDMLFLTGTDLVNALVLLSGIIMLPTNLYIVYAIAKGKSIELCLDDVCPLMVGFPLVTILPIQMYYYTIKRSETLSSICTSSYDSKVICCRLRTCLIWIIIVNTIGVFLCIQRIYSCHAITMQYISNSIRQYRTVPKHKHFIDNIQWYLGCCGLHSYKDWFTQDWHDKVRDYEWSPINLRSGKSARGRIETDSVPFSCCKSGTCVSSYLKELGTYSVNTKGCGFMMYRIIMISLSIHLTMFLIVIVLEGLLLKYTSKKSFTSRIGINKFNIKNIMSINDNFEISSGPSASYRSNAEDSDDADAIGHYKKDNEDH